jgi:hypothetical protein
MPMPVINIGALFIGRENREGENGSGDATEDDDDTDAEAGGFGRRRGLKDYWVNCKCSRKLDLKI